MNDYIFDWAENSEKILAGGGYTSKVHQTFEQIMLFAYLREKGYSKDEIFSLWIKTDSLLLQKIGDDKDQRDKYFGKLFADSTKYKIEKGNRIDVYQSEIDFINNMEVSMWIKQYVLAMLCIYKWYGKEWCVYNDKIKRFCYSCTSTKKERDTNTQALFQCLDCYHPYIVNGRDIFLSFKMLTKEDGLIIKSIKQPRDCNKLFNLLTTERVCKNCNKVFIYSKINARRTLCDECYKKYRYSQQNKYHKTTNLVQHYNSERNKINPNKES